MEGNLIGRNKTMKTPETAKKIASLKGYDFYTWKDESGKQVYNVCSPENGVPVGGYYDPLWICSMKNVPNLFTQVQS
jgi:hypothetical protein